MPTASLIFPAAKPAGPTEFFWDQMLMKAMAELCERSFRRGDHSQPIKSALITAIMKSDPGTGFAGELLSGDFPTEHKLLRSGAYRITSWHGPVEDPATS